MFDGGYGEALEPMRWPADDRAMTTFAAMRLASQRTRMASRRTLPCEHGRTTAGRGFAFRVTVAIRVPLRYFVWPSARPLPPPPETVPPAGEPPAVTTPRPTLPPWP